MVKLEKRDLFVNIPKGFYRNYVVNGAANVSCRK